MATRQKPKFEFEFVEELPEEMTCSICVKVLCQPHLMNCCGQQFCEACLEKWLESNKTCPHCHSTDFSHMLMKRTSMQVGNLKVYCPNKQHGCETILKISECDNHLSAGNAEGCVYVKLRCPYLCSFKAFRNDVKYHIELQCPRRQVLCSHCTLQAEHQFIVGDHVNTCPLYPVDCPQKCGATVLRKDLMTHRDTCPEEIMLCPYSELGCKIKVCCKDLEKHVESSLLQHMTELVKSHLSLKAEHKKLKEEHMILKNDYTAFYSAHKDDHTQHERMEHGMKPKKKSALRKKKV